MSRNYTGLGRYEQLFDQLDAAISRLESRCDKIERRVTNLPASKATYRRYSSNYDTDPYQQPTRFRPCHEQPPGWPPPQRSPPSCWPGQRRRHAYGKQQQTHAAPRRQSTCLDLPERRIQQGVSAYNPQPLTGKPTAEQQPLLQRPPSCRHPSSGTIDEETCFMDHEIDYLSDNEKGVGHGSITATGTLSAPTHAAESRCFSLLHLHHDPYISSPLAVAAILPPQPAIFPSCSPVMINTLSSAPLHAVPPPQAAISPVCSPDMINIVVQRRGKSSMPKGEIKSIFSNKRIIGRTASGNQQMITGFGCLRDTKMEQEKLNATDASIGFSYVMAETRDQLAIKSVYIGHEIVGYWGARQQSRAFDPGGVASPKHIFAKIVIVSWFPP